RCVPRHCLTTRHARRSLTSYSSRACSTAHRRRSGLRSFPPQYPSGSVCPTTAPRPAVSTCRFLSPVPSVAWPVPSSSRSLHSAEFHEQTVERLDGDRGFCASLWVGITDREDEQKRPQHRHDLLWFVPL